MDAIALGLITVMALLVGMGVYSHQRGQSRPGAPGSRPYGSGAPTSARPGTGARGRIRVVDPNVPSGRTPRADPTHIQVRSPETQGCQVCGDAIGPGEPYTECEAGHPHHRACTALTDHCAMQNCPRPFK